MELSYFTWASIKLWTVLTGSVPNFTVQLDSDMSSKKPKLVFPSQEPDVFPIFLFSFLGKHKTLLVYNIMHSSIPNLAPLFKKLNPERTLLLYYRECPSKKLNFERFSQILGDII